MRSDAEPLEIDVSIVMFNSARWIATFLDSLVGQDHPVSRINLWVRDNGSDVAEYEQCRQEIERRAGAFGSVRLDRGENVGFGSGHNRNFAQGQAAFFLVTNVDLEFDRGSIAAALAALRADDATVACREFRQQPYEHPKHYNPATLETSWCSSACVLFRRSAFAAVAGYDDRIFLYGEDVDLSFRLRCRGYQLRYCPRAVCQHHTYPDPDVLKPAQVYGSREANFYLRLRFGTLWDILVGFALQAGQWLFPEKMDRYYRGLARTFIRTLANAAHFLRTRQRLPPPFRFHGWNYEASRLGAFYSIPARTHALPLVSIIIRTHAGRAGWVREATASVVNQTYGRIELILVEDGCSEADALVADLRSRGRFESVRHVQVPKRGRAAAGNAGLAAAQGELIGFLDDDDLLYADHLEVLVAELARDDQSAGVYARAFEAPTQVVSEEPFRYEELSLVLSDSPEFSRDRMARGNFLPIQSVLFRRSCYQTHGGFDEDMESYEDWLLWVKYTANAPFRKVDKLTSLYRVPCEEEAFLRRWQTMMRDWPMARQRVFAAAPIRGADVETADSPPADPGPSLRRLRMARWSARYRSIGSLLAFWQRLVIFVALRLKRNAYVYEQVRGLYRKFRI